MRKSDRSAGLTGSEDLPGERTTGHDLRRAGADPEELHPEDLQTRGSIAGDRITLQIQRK